MKLSVQDLAQLFGTTVEDVQLHCGDLVGSDALNYRKITGEERDQLILQVLNRIINTDLVRAGEDRQPDWERGWRENLEEFVASNYNLELLIPKYFKKNVPARLNLDYVMPVAPDFVFYYTHVFRTWVFKKYLADVKSIYEFGCGPGYHLAYLAQMYPDKNLFGLDWARSSQEILKLLAAHFGWKITGKKFDFFQPDHDVVLAENSGVFTFGALEQIGGRHEKFIEFLLERKPAICVNVECLHELYETDKLLSFLALQYHTKRNYLSGYLTALQKLEKQKRLEIIKVHHQKFGNLFDDPFSFVIWKPL